MLSERSIDISSGDLRLEGLLHEGDAEPAWVVLHPHPQYGGDMHNHVVEAMCAALASRGCATLRFNFRGTGRSTGAYDGGKGERLDALAAFAHLRQVTTGPVAIAGYSFGAAIAASIADEAQAVAVVLVSPPAIGGTLHIPTGRRILAITGDQDAVAPASAISRLSGPHVTAIVAPGVDHGWWPGIETLREQVAGFEPLSG